MADLGLPDDRPRVSELIKFFELLIKGQLEESLLLDLHSEAVRKIRNAVNDCEGMSLLIRAFEENPTLLHKLRKAAGNKKGLMPKLRSQSLKGPSTQSSQPPPVLRSQSQPVPKPVAQQHASLALKEMLANLVDVLAGNASVIIQFSNYLFSSGLIPKAVHYDAQNTVLSSIERASKVINAVLATLNFDLPISNPLNPSTVFKSFVTALHKVGLTTIAIKLMECFSKCMHH